MKICDIAGDRPPRYGENEMINISRLIVLLTITLCMPVSAEFKIHLFDGEAELTPPYELISGKAYRLTAVSTDGQRVPVRWFISKNLGKVSGEPPVFTAVFVGEGTLIAKGASVEQAAPIKIVPATQTIGIEGGTFSSPAGVKIEFPPNAFLTPQRIAAEIIAPPGLPLSESQRLVSVIRLSPDKLVLKRPAQLQFAHNEAIPPIPRIHFWERYQKRWVPLSGRVNALQGTVTATINHLGVYTLIAPKIEMLRSNRLTIENVTLSPRVFFAPDMHRLTITYHLNAPDAVQAFVTMDIFDLRDRRLRRLLDNAPCSIGPNVAQWDGLTDENILVRNGRYILVIHAKAAAQNAVARKLIVVFK